MFVGEIPATSRLNGNASYFNAIETGGGLLHPVGPAWRIRREEPRGLPPQREQAKHGITSQRCRNGGIYSALTMLAYQGSKDQLRWTIASSKIARVRPS